MNTAPMTSSMNVMGTATTTSLPLMISSVESVSGVLPRFSLRSSMTPLDCVDLCWPELSETLRSSMLPTCVATSPESTCGSMEPAELGGQTADAPPLDLLGADERIAVGIDDPDGCLPLGGAAADERHEIRGGKLAAQRAFNITGDDLPLGNQVADFIAGENLRRNDGVNARNQQGEEHHRAINQHQHAAERSAVAFGIMGKDGVLLRTGIV